MNHRLIMFLGILACSPPVAQADDSVVEQTKDGAKSVANDVDKGAHKAKRRVTHQARETKTDIRNSNDDSTTRKAGRRVKDAGNDTLDKVDDTVHGH